MRDLANRNHFGVEHKLPSRQYLFLDQLAEKVCLRVQCKKQDTLYSSTQTWGFIDYMNN